MRIVVALALLLSSALGGATELDLAPSRAPLEHPRNDGLRMRNAGIGTLVSSVLCLAAGTALVVAGSNPQRNDDGIFVDTGLGISLLTAGGLGTIVGIPLIAVGERRANAAERATLQLSAAGAVVRF